MEVDDSGNLQFVALRNPSKISKRYGRSIPYVDLLFDKEALLGVCLSPTINVEKRKIELKSLLSKYNIEDVSKSKIPVRY